MNKGFTLIEMLVVLLMMTVFSIVFSVGVMKYEKTYFNPIKCQLEAMSKKEKCQLNEYIHFNENGNINHAQTVKINGKTCVFQLGMGRYHCE